MRGRQSVAVDQGEGVRGRLRLRPLRESDLDAVVALERTGYHHPWPRWWFRRLLRSHCSCWVVEDGRAVVGYGIMQLKSSWAHIMNVCVAPPARRHGVGTRIMRHLLDLARREHATGAWLEVRPGNVQALQLYRRLGFRAIGRRRHYYRDRWGRTDASVMIRRQAGG